jgi:hypothetical protein
MAEATVVDPQLGHPAVGQRHGHEPGPPGFERSEEILQAPAGDRR